MALSIVVNDNKFRVEGQGYFTDWLPDTPSNRKAMLVFLRLLRDETGKPVYTFQDLSVIVDSDNRQASSGHMERFRECGCDILAFLTRKRKVDSEVVDAVTQELLDTPLAEISELSQRVNARLGRDDLSPDNIKAALDQIPCSEIRATLRKQIASGEAHYQEEYLLGEMMSSMPRIGQEAGLAIPEETGMKLSDPTSIKQLVTPEAGISSVKESLRWVVYCMVFYHYGVPLSVLGNWLKVHKTTVLRWVISLSLELFPIVYRWIQEKVDAKIVCIDEKWLKIRGKWYYWFVVLDTCLLYTSPSPRDLSTSRMPSSA